MSCSTCGHTMGGFGKIEYNGANLYLCQRCGTAKVISPSGFTETYVPALVKRCQEFAATLGPSWGTLAHKLGILESIYLPEDRPNI